MFRVKHRKAGVWTGSGRGLARAGRGLGRAEAARAAIWTAIAGLLLTACSSPDEIAAKTATASAAAGAGVQAADPATPPAAAHGAAAFTDNATKGEAVRNFAYTWPAAVGAIPQLTRRFTAERDRLLADQKADWESALKEFSAEDCAGCVSRDFQKTWDVVADLPRFLSLSATFYEYTGGAHGNGAFEALVWDREDKAAIDPKAMFRSAAALQGALGPAWCKALEVERKTRLGPDHSDDGFFPCPPVSDLTVLVGSSDKQGFNRIGLLAAPYVAGSYAEGPYEITLPVTPKVLAAVKPEYKAAFSLGK